MYIVPDEPAAMMAPASAVGLEDDTADTIRTPISRDFAATIANLLFVPRPARHSLTTDRSRRGLHPVADMGRRPSSWIVMFRLRGRRAVLGRRQALEAKPVPLAAIGRAGAPGFGPMSLRRPGFAANRG